MNRKSLPNLLLATALVLLLPLEQVVCACMGFATQPTRVAAAAGHECCEAAGSSGSERHSRPEQAPHSCSCQRLAEGALTAVSEGIVHAPAVAPVAVLSGTTIVVPVPAREGTTPARDVGSSSLPDTPGAHGLRAPPVTA